jgi:hypothetical protein
VRCIGHVLACLYYACARARMNRGAFLARKACWGATSRRITNLLAPCWAQCLYQRHAPHDRCVCKPRTCAYASPHLPANPHPPTLAHTYTHARAHTHPHLHFPLSILLTWYSVGRCKTVIIATVTPSVISVEESLSTLSYAQVRTGSWCCPARRTRRCVLVAGGRHSVASRTRRCVLVAGAVQPVVRAGAYW